jgi:signal transduction histidine kinase
MILTGLVPVLAVAVSVLVNVHAMVLSRHDSVVILIALGWATVIGTAMTVIVARWVANGSQALRLGLRRLDPGDGSSLDQALQLGRASAAPAELAALLTELNVVRQRLVASRNRERALENSRRELVTFMSHDLRTPLTGLRALAEALDDGMIEDIPAATARIQAYVDRMTSLVEDLFQLSKVTSGTSRRPPQPVSLAELAMDVVAEAGDHAHRQGIDVELELEMPADRLPVLGDSDELARAIGNLVANAVRHTPRGGQVRVLGSRDQNGESQNGEFQNGEFQNGAVRISVVDGCGGIPDADLAHVFEAGWRGHDGRALDDAGAGLGLAIARGVVQAHSGRIEVRNVDPGCRFEIVLPPVPQQPNPPSPTPQPPNPQPLTPISPVAQPLTPQLGAEVTSMPPS